MYRWLLETENSWNCSVIPKTIATKRCLTRKANLSITMRYHFLFLAIPACLVASCGNDSSTSKNDQPLLGTRSLEIIEHDSKQFKDLNRNGELDPYEDWRLSPQERSKDLLQRMSFEEKVGMMLIADIKMTNEVSIMDFNAQQEGEITTAFNEEDVVVANNQFTGEPLPYPVMNTVGTTKGIIDQS